MNVTYTDLIQFCIFVITLVGLCYEIFKGKKYIPHLPDSVNCKKTGTAKRPAPIPVSAIYNKNVSRENIPFYLKEIPSRYFNRIFPFRYLTINIFMLK